MPVPPSAAICNGNQQRIHYHLAGRPDGRRRLLLLHGSGVDGWTTWGHVAARLTAWDTLLIPDLRGVGDTGYPDGRDRPFSADEVIDDLQRLLRQLDWRRFDVAGYSYGGLMAMLLKQAMPAAVGLTFLLEAAGLGARDHAALLAGRAPLDIAAQLLENGQAEAGARLFMDTALPNRLRTPAGEAWLLARLLARPLGFAGCLRCVNAALRQVDIDALLAAQAHVMLLSGSRSPAAVAARAAELAATRGWQSVLVAGADHGLPLQKPRQVAAIFNAVATGTPLPAAGVRR